MELSDCYFRVCKECFVQRGYTYQFQKRIDHPMSPSGKMDMTYPTDVDLIGIKPTTKEVFLVECTETIDSVSTPKLIEKFRRHSMEFAGAFSGFNIRRVVTCVRLASGYEDALTEMHVEFVDAKHMVEDLLRYDSERHRGDPVMWLLRTLSGFGMIKKPV